MPEPKFEPNPERYQRLAAPVSEEEAQRRLKEFHRRLGELREECGIAEFTAIFGVYLELGKLNMSIASYGHKERGVDMAVTLTKHLARDLAESHRERADALEALAGDEQPR